ncbi:MAG: DUF1553 domain-containing protein, partial [Gemmataceae bacterium]|nr:DUF1553 domain-containing protein [Gemmataceae bacterium]
ALLRPAAVRAAWEAMRDPSKAREANRAERAAQAAEGKPLTPEGNGFAPLAGSLKTAENNVESEASRRKPYPATSSGRRAALAKWITARENPLAARVAVNHVWLRHFGTPLVATVFDFGRKGAAPTHPELLDWLAVEFMEGDWSMKRLHRLLVTSAAYRKASSGSDRADPENRTYWRMNSVRMEAPVIRDSLLSLSGGLDRRLGGPPVPAAMETGRRSLYFFSSHNEQNKFLTIFDEANVLECYRRSESVLPQQALALQNSRLASDAAERIAARIGEKGPEGFARAAFRLVLCQSPTAEELAECVAALKAGMTRGQLVHALLNHNDFITIR